MNIDQLLIKLDEKWSLQGKLGTLLAFSMIASIDGDYRIPIGGLLVHLYLLVMLPVIAIGKISFWKASSKILTPLLILLFLFIISLAREANANEIVKIISGITTFLVFLKIVKSEKDFTIISLGFITLSLIVSINTYFAAQEDFSLAGVNSLSGIGNKNAQSLYTLPGLFFLCYLLDPIIKNRKLILLLVWIVVFLIILGGIAYTGNRSGYLGAIIILGILIYQNFRSNIKGLIIVFLVLGIGYQLLNGGGEESQLFSLLDHKWTQTTTGYESDSYRQNLFYYSLMTGIENPILGLGSEGLMRELADKVTDGRYQIIDPHNIYGYVLGSSGVLAFLAFVIFFVNLVRISFRYSKVISVLEKKKTQIAFWCIAFIILYLSRAFFTREVLYSPTMMGGLGLIFGLLMTKFRKSRLKFLGQLN